MDSEGMIPVREFCVIHQIELTFVLSLNESGLIDLIGTGENSFLPESQLKLLEQLVHLKEEMDINVEGIETISYLLQRIRDLQSSIVRLNNALAFYQGS